MRKLLSIICMLIIAILLPTAWMVSNGLPTDTNRYVAQKYNGWTGVLQAWVCCEWEPGGNFISWLNQCGSAFEKEHEGIYIEFTPVNQQTLRGIWESGLRAPEILLFSPGALNSSEGLLELKAPSPFRNSLRVSEYALPVAMGGYIWVYNRTLTSGAPTLNDSAPLHILPDEDGRSFSPALVCLMQKSSENELALPELDPGIDLGLPANAQAGMLMVSEDALEDFMRGEIAAMPVTQRELARLTRLQENGQGPDWACEITGNYAWADQLLLCSLTRQQGTASDTREALAEEFLQSLFSDENQAKLQNAGAFSVTGSLIHDEHSVYRSMDVLLNSRDLIVPQPFSEHSPKNAGVIIRQYLAGEYSPPEAIAKMGLSLTLPNQPN